MPDDEHTQRWQRISRPVIDLDPMQAMRSCIAEVRRAPRDPEAQRQLHALAADKDLWEPLALLLTDEARAAQATRPEVAAVFYDALVGVHENLDQAMEAIAAMEHVVAFAPDDLEQHDRLAWLYRRAGAWQKAAEEFERVADLAQDDRARAALHAAGKLYRDNSRLDRAVTIYRAIVARRASDVGAWRVLDELLAELGRWREVAEVRATLAARVHGGVEKAALLRAQARALEQAGEKNAATELVATASRHAPDNVSGLVDYASVLARDGRGREAADVLAVRVSEAIERGASNDDVAGLRARLVVILEDACGDLAGSAVVLATLLADAPMYVPALERLVTQASRDPDARVHAAALLRLADALAPGADQTRTVIHAARRFRDAGDHRGAAAAFKRAAELAPADDTVRRELVDARTELVIERAAEEAGAGETDAAERRLRTLVAQRPEDLGANLALAEVLATSGRLTDAAEHLRTTLAAAPANTPGVRLAPVVLRYGRVLAALGDADEAHALLHEAHRLDRRNLQTTLALGESCFSRRLWREAALHLGALADHPDAAQHAAEVAIGLVHAAQADVRALRPANADKRYEAAVRLDPNCAPAWHALADMAMAKGDTARAADHFEREANATTEPRTRLRLFDALGDLCLDTLGDPVRAERAWTQVADAKNVALLDKLLASQRRRGAGIERGETCERLAALQTDKRAMQELIEEAAQAYATGGDVPRARAMAERVMAEAPRDLDAIACASRVMLDLGDAVRAAMWLRRAFAAWDAAGDRGDEDPRRADLWRRLGDAERAKGDEDAARIAYERAIATAPDSNGALGARRGLVALAATSVEDAIEMLDVLVEAEQEPLDVLAWARELTRANRIEDAHAGYELAQALGVQLHADDDEFLATTQPRQTASDEAYGARLDDDERKTLIDDPADAPLGELLELVAEAASMVCPDVRTALARAGVADAQRVAASSDAAPAALYPQIANALGGPPTLLHATASPAAPDLRLLASAPPVLVLGPRLASVRALSRADTEPMLDAELRFRLGRIVELSRARRLFAGGLERDAFIRFVAALRHAFGGAAAASTDRDVIAEADRVHKALPVSLRRRIGERLAVLPAAALDPTSYLAACERAADRAGLLACGRVDVAISLAGGAIAARHLVRLAASPRYLAARRKLRPRRA